MYRCIIRGTPGDNTDVPATKLSLTYRILTLSFPLQSCRSRMQKIIPKMRDTIVSGSTATERERECLKSVRERQLCSGDVGFVTWRSSSYSLISPLNLSKYSSSNILAIHSVAFLMCPSQFYLDHLTDTKAGISLKRLVSS